MIAQITRGILQVVLGAFGGNLTAQGLLTDDQLQQGIGAVLTLVALGWVVWQNKRKRSVPGGEFNPRAEVRRALPEEGLAQRRRGAEEGKKFRLPWERRGCARLPALAAMAIWLVGFAALGLGIESCRDWRVTRTEVFPDVTETPDLSHWIKFAPREDGRPFLERLMRSATLRVEIRKSETGNRNEKTPAPSAADGRRSRPISVFRIPHSAFVTACFSASW